MLIPLNDGRWEQYVLWCPVTEVHASQWTLWCPEGLRCVFLSPYPVCAPFRCQGGLRAHHMEICEKRSLSRHIQYIQPASTLIDVNASAHTHTRAGACTCTKRGRVEDHWSVKWFCYRVVCVEYIFPSTFCGRCGLLVPLCVYVCWCVSVLCGALRLSVVGQEEVGSETKHKNKVTVSEQLLRLTFWHLVTQDSYSKLL